jgi:uncharacterized damage-inducible protein DinB
MKPDEISLLYKYHYWVDQRILTACAKTSDEQFLAPSRYASRGSLRATLVHMVDSIWQWRLTCTGFYSTQLSEVEYEATQLTETTLPTFKLLKERWHTEKLAMWGYIETLTDEKLNGILCYVSPGGFLREYPLWQCLFHAINHGTQHHSEAAALLSNYGYSPGDIDFTVFLKEHASCSDASLSHLDRK